MSNSSPKRYGFRVFIGSCIFSALTIGFVLYDEHRQSTRRQVSVQNRLQSIQQKENMKEYEEQRKKYEEYKTANS
uniref:Cytochrome c oxidase assembly protein n=1 Tax=Panagrolaimus superbus TaxID=310955 RepID=A0A914YNF3_9BILA